MTLVKVLLLVCFVSGNLNCIGDSISDIRIKNMEYEIQQIRSNEVNYKLENQLIKDMYSLNYQTISFIVTIASIIFAVLTFLGFRDVRALKNAYQEELSKLKIIKEDFDSERKKTEANIHLIQQASKEQDEKIRFLELKEKIIELIKNGALDSALGYAEVAIAIKRDADILSLKARILSRMNRYEDAITSINDALQLDPKNQILLTNLAEYLLFGNKLQAAKEAFEETQKNFNYRTNEANIILPLIRKYQEKDTNYLIQKLQTYLIEDKDKTVMTKKIKNWDLADTLFFIQAEPTSKCKLIFHNLIWYLNGQVTGLYIEGLIKDFTKK